MNLNELPPDDDADRHIELTPDDAAAVEDWDFSGQLDGHADDGSVLRDVDDETTEESDDADTGFSKDDAEEVATSRLFEPTDDSVVEAARAEYLRGVADVRATSPEREAEIMGYPEAPAEAAERGHQNADDQKNTKLMGVYEVAGYLQRSTEEPEADTAEVDDDVHTWTTETGRVSIRHHPEYDNEDTSVRSKLPNMEHIETQPGTLEVQAQQRVPFNDAGDIVEVSVRVSFETDENGKVYWKSLSAGFTRPDDGAPCPEAEEALLGGFAQEDLPPGVTIDQAIDNSLLSYVWDNTREAFSYATQDGEQDNYTDTDVDEAEAAAIAKEIEAEEAAESDQSHEEFDDGGKSIRDRALNDAGMLLYAYDKMGSTESADTMALRNAYANLAAIAGREGNADLVARYSQMLEDLGDVPAETLARVYGAGCDAGDQEMHTKLDTLLTGEMIDRMNADESDPYGLRSMYGLQQVIRDYEAQGFPPETLLENYTFRAEERFVLSRAHYARTQDTDPAAAMGLHLTIQEFVKDGGRSYAPQFIADMTSYTLDVCRDPALRAQAVDQYMSAVDRLPVSTKSFNQLILIGGQVLDDKELSASGFVQQLDLMIDIQAEKLGNSEYRIHWGSRMWNVKQIAHSDVPVEGLIKGIKDSTEESIKLSDPQAHETLAIDHSALLQTAAESYAAQGKFVQSRAVIAELGMRSQANAYESCLQSAKTPSDVRQLKPSTHAQNVAFDPDIAMLFAASEARVSGDVRAMEAQVKILAGFVAQAGKEQDDSTIPDATRCWTQATTLLNTMNEVQPGSEYVAARAFLKGMAQSGRYGSDLTMLSFAFGGLMESSNPVDHMAVYEAIRDVEGSGSKKAELLTRLALHISD